MDFPSFKHGFLLFKEVFLGNEGSEEGESGASVPACIFSLVSLNVRAASSAGFGVLLVDELVHAVLKLLEGPPGFLYSQGRVDLPGRENVC